ncbi:hypothetical protein QVD17_19784 [Tagetes erecta]|uniref:Uncharacterized protein n=1 Tax=Tagetes erecta TaxID=13708 RepID=A0AAD8KK22_TARER|nr:hypothetical protein QVD17_19784 [Tagetes erecta]
METKSTPKSARRVSFQVQDDEDNEHNGIARKVVNIDGIPLLPRRGKFINANPIMEAQDELAEKVQIIGPDVGSYAAVLHTGTSKNKINFRFLEPLDKQQGVDVVLPRESFKIVQEKLGFTLYGYFLGDRVAYPVVEYFVKMNWQKYGLQRGDHG